MNQCFDWRRGEIQSPRSWFLRPPHLRRRHLLFEPLEPRTLLDGLGLLPPSVRDGFEIAWGPGHELAARTLGTGLHAWVRSLPRSWRAMPQARAAERRSRRPTFGDARSGHGWATIHVRH